LQADAKITDCLWALCKNEIWFFVHGATLYGRRDVGSQNVDKKSENLFGKVTSPITFEALLTEGGGVEVEGILA
jgi:hypothetical protein